MLFRSLFAGEFAVRRDALLFMECMQEEHFVALRATTEQGAHQCGPTYVGDVQGKGENVQLTGDAKHIASIG